MKILAHLLRTDLARYRVLLSIWLLTVAALTVVDGLRPVLVYNTAVIELLAVIGGLLWIASVGLTIVLVPLIVQSDQVVGTQAFWVTRPIPPVSLLLSKAVLVWVALVAAPALLRGALMFAYQVPAQPLTLVLLEYVLLQTVWVSLLMVAAALTPNLSRFALLCGGAVLALALVASIVLVVESIAREPARRPYVPAIEDPTASLIQTLVMIATAGALLVVLYRTRLRARAAAVGVAGLLVMWIAGQVWPWPFLRVRVEPPAWAADPSRLQLTLDPASVETHEGTFSFRREEAWTFVSGRFEISGVPPGWSAQPLVDEAEVEVVSGGRVTSVFEGFVHGAPWLPGLSRAIDPVIRDVLGVRRAAEPAHSRSDIAVLMRIRDDDFTRVAPAVGTYEGTFHVRLTQHEIAAALPLEPGATYQSGAYRLVVHRTTRIGNRVSLLVTESDARSMFETRPRPHHTFYLRNARAAEALTAHPEPLVHSRPLAFLLPFHVSAASPESGFIARGLWLRFGFPYGPPPQEPMPVVDQEWLAGADLVVVRSIGAGSVERSLRLDNFPVQATKRSGF